VRAARVIFPLRPVRGTSTADFDDMMTLMFIALAVLAVGLIVELITAARSPLGYQDESGFHLGREQTASGEALEFENPS
jgi:hypothetical protein